VAALALLSSTYQPGSSAIEQCFSLATNRLISRGNHQPVFSITLLGFGFFNDAPSK
jgi:hypothetical protein